MNDDLKELGITPDEDMEEGDTKPGEVVDDKVATGDVGNNEDDDTEAGEVSMEEAKKLEEAAAAAREKEEDEE